MPFLHFLSRQVAQRCLRGVVRPAVPRPSLLGLLIVLTSIGAGLPAQGGGAAPRLTFINHADEARTEWGLGTVSFAPGVFRDGMSFRVEGAPSEVIPFGARWPDGSVRFAQAAARVDLAPREERSWRVVQGRGEPGAFRFSPWVASRLAGFAMDLVVGVPGVGQRRVGLDFFHMVEDTAVRKTGQFRARVPDTDLVYDLWITFFHDQDFARFELRLTSSDSTSPEWQQSVDYVILTSRNAVPVVRGATRLGMVAGDVDPGGVNPVLLMGPTSFFNGQAHDWYGELLFFDGNRTVANATRRLSSMRASMVEELWGCADNWPDTGAFGPFGYVPEPPPWLQVDGGRAASEQARRDFRTFYYGSGQVWEDRPKGLYPAAAVTGNQHDFGVAKFVEVFRTGLPLGIAEARYVAGEEAHRPVHHREPDGGVVRAVDHPDWVALHGRTHWSPTVSPDRLGKPWPVLSPTGRSHGWTGKDDEHWSSLVLSSAYLLTRSFSLGMELDNEAELYLASHTVPSLKPSWPSNHIGNGRATGRTFLTQSWVYLVTGREMLAERMVARVRECVIPQHHGLGVGGSVRPITITDPDARAVTSGPYWSPWEESQAAMGLAAVTAVTGAPEADAMAELITRNLIEHGWRVDFDNTLIGYAMRYLDGGLPLPISWLNNSEHVVWPDSRDFMVWALPSTRLAMHYAVRSNDPALLARAQQIHAVTLSLRRPSPSGPNGWDSFTGWDGVPIPR